MMLIQHHKASEYRDRAIDQFDQLYADAAQLGAGHGARRPSLHHGRAAPAQVFPRRARPHPRGIPACLFWTGEQILDWYLTLTTGG